MLEAFYSNVGHDYYTKILKIFEKYCQYGKINSSFGMDYSQFSTFMIQNNLYDQKNSLTAAVRRRDRTTVADLTTRDDLNASNASRETLYDRFRAPGSAAS